MLRRRDQACQLSARLGPGRSEAFSGTREQLVGELAGAEAGEPGQHLLLAGRCRPLLLLDLLQEADGDEIVGRTLAPARGQPAIAIEVEVGPHRLRGLGRIG